MVRAPSAARLLAPPPSQSSSSRGRAQPSALLERPHREVRGEPLPDVAQVHKPSDFQGRRPFVKFDPSNCGADVSPEGPQ